MKLQPLFFTLALCGIAQAEPIQLPDPKVEAQTAQALMKLNNLPDTKIGFDSIERVQMLALALAKLGRQERALEVVKKAQLAGLGELRDLRDEVRLAGVQRQCYVGNLTRATAG